LTLYLLGANPREALRSKNRVVIGAYFWDPSAQQERQTAAAKAAAFSTRGPLTSVPNRHWLTLANQQKDFSGDSKPCRWRSVDCHNNLIREPLIAILIFTGVFLQYW
jgi:hypothetical protein